MSIQQIAENLIQLELDGKINPFTSFDIYSNEELEGVSKLLISYANARQDGILRNAYVSILGKIDEHLREDIDFSESEDSQFEDTYIDNFIDNYA